MENPVRMNSEELMTEIAKYSGYMMAFASLGQEGKWELAGMKLATANIMLGRISKAIDDNYSNKKDK